MSVTLTPYCAEIISITFFAVTLDCSRFTLCISISCTSSNVICSSRSFARAFKFVSVPSSSLTFVSRESEIYSKILSSISIPCAFAMFFKIIIRVSYPGLWISTVRPDKNLDSRRFDRFFISFGDLSLIIIICFPSSCNLLNVWKNSSSTVPSPRPNTFSKNCISSRRSTSKARNVSRKC